MTRTTEQVKNKPKPRGRPPRRLTFEELPQVPSVRQVASFLGKHETTVYEWIAKGEFPPAVRTKGRKVISKAKLAEWLGIPYQGVGTDRGYPDYRETENLHSKSSSLG